MTNPGSTQTEGTDTSGETFSFMRAEFDLLEHMRESLVNLVNQRFNFLLALVSATLVAISFLGNELHFSAVFFLIASGLLGSVLILGLIVFARALEGEVMTIIYIRALNRIRNYFVTHDPTIRDYLMMPWYDDVPSFYAPGYDISKASDPWWTRFTNLPAMIAVINSTLVSFLGVSIAQFLIMLDSSVAAGPEEPLHYLVLTALVGLAGFAAGLFLQLRRIGTRMSEATAKFHVHFRTPRGADMTGTSHADGAHGEPAAARDSSLDQA
jgi:hypothetical protein